MVTKVLEKVEQLIFDAKFQQALDTLQTSKNGFILDFSLKMHAKLLECLLYRFLHNADQALQCVKDFYEESVSAGNPLVELDAICLLLLEEHVVINEALSTEYIQRGHQLLEAFPHRNDARFLSREVLFNYSLSDHYWVQGHEQKNIDFLNQGLEARKQVQTPTFWLRLKDFHIDLDLGYYYYAQGQLNKALKYYQEGMAKIANAEVRVYLNEYYNVLTSVCLEKGDFKKAEEYNEKKMTLLKEMEFPESNFGGIFTKGLIAEAQGDYNRALGYYQQFEEAKTLIQSTTNLSSLHIKMGVIHAIRGEFEKAQALLSSGLKHFHLERDRRRFSFYLSFGVFLAERGELQQAIQYLDRGLVEIRQLNQLNLLSNFLSLLIRILSEQGDTERLSALLTELKQIHETSDSDIIAIQYQLSQALVLKSSERLPDWMQALSMFSAIADGPVIHTRYTVSAILNMSELLIFEYQVTGSQKVLEDIKIRLNALLSLADAQNNHKLRVETYLLMAKIALLELNVNKAQKLQEKALEIAEDKQLEWLKNQIIKEQHNLSQQLNRWHTFSANNYPIKEIFELTRIDAMVKQMFSSHPASPDDYKQQAQYARFAQDLYEELERYSMN